MSTARDLIKGSLRLIGALATGETPSADELTDGLAVLNDMLDSWSTENLIVYAKTREEFTLTPGTQAYTIGTGGTFSTTRPIEIEQALLQKAGTSPALELPIRIINEAEWAAIPIKNIAGLPQVLYSEGAYPLDILNLWPNPQDASKLVLFTLKPLSAFTAGTTVSLPPGYARALRYNLAIELAPEYGKPISEQILLSAVEAKENIKRKNSKPQYLAVDQALMTYPRGFNIYTGE